MPKYNSSVGNIIFANILYLLVRTHMILTSYFLTPREYMPTLEEFFEEAIEQADPENMVENEYK